MNNMNLLTIEHLTKSYTERLLFNDTAFLSTKEKKWVSSVSTAQENLPCYGSLQVWRSRMAVRL